MSSSLPVVRVGLAGAGAVGGGVIQLLSNHHDVIVWQTGYDVHLSALAVRDLAKPRDFTLTNVDIIDTPLALATRDDVDVVIEVMGGMGNPALALIRSSLENNKPVITANKALLAHHGHDLSVLARTHETPLLFEASVGGGLPIIKVLREGLAVNRITKLTAILNGTCNYILTTMEKTGADFATVLDQAQRLGYAEADPTLDIDGHDSAHKLAILAAIATGKLPRPETIQVQGIRDISRDDLKFAKENGARIKLLAQMRHDGKLIVAPAPIPLEHPLAHVDDALNAVVYEASAVGEGMMMGRGAGPLPTASAILADLIDLLTSRASGTFGLPVQ